MSSRHLQSRSRSGFTLLELMLVLALLVMLGALVFPALERPFASERLKQGADQIRAEWVRARVRAMTHGVPQVFRFQPETGNFRLEAWGSMDTNIEATSAMAFESAAQQPVLHGTNLEGDRSLPEDVYFVASQSVLDSKSLTVGPAAGGGTLADQVSWSEPIYFYPDGTTSTVMLRLRNDDGLFVDLELRGLTGVVSVSDVMNEQELPR